MKFFEPVIDKENSIKMIIHILSIDNEYVSTLELEYPDEDSLSRESLFAMLESIEVCRQKIEKVLDII